MHRCDGQSHVLQSSLLFSQALLQGSLRKEHP